MIERFFFVICSILALSGQQSYAAVVEPTSKSEETSSKIAPLSESRSSDQAQRMLYEAVAQIQLKQFDQAEQLLQNLSTLYPENPIPFLNLAVIANQKNQLEQASTLLEHAKTLAPDLPDVNLDLAKVYLNLARKNLNQLMTKSADDNAPEIQKLKTQLESLERTIKEPLTPNTPDGRDYAQAEIELRKTVEAWQTAWSEAKLDDYLIFYAPDFRPQTGSRKLWVQHKQKVFLRDPAKSIRIDIQNIRISGKRADLTLREQYHSTRRQETGQKILVLEQRDEKWLIVREKFLASPPPKSQLSQLN